MFSSSSAFTINSTQNSPLNRNITCEFTPFTHSWAHRLLWPTLYCTASRNSLLKHFKVHPWQTRRGGAKAKSVFQDIQYCTLLSFYASFLYSQTSFVNSDTMALAQFPCLISRAMFHFKCFQIIQIQMLIVPHGKFVVQLGSNINKHNIITKCAG